MYPIKVIHPPMEPAVSVVVPYAEGKPFNPIYICANDEVLIAKGGESIGHARIEAARQAKNEWLIFMDADAIYPPDYIPNIKYYIGTYGFPIMATKRKGGFGDLFSQVLEHGLIARKNVFLERTKNYPEGVWWRGGRTDVVGYFRDAVKIPVEYYHSFTTDEKAGLSALLGLLIISIALLKRHSSEIESTEAVSYTHLTLPTICSV